MTASRLRMRALATGMSALLALSLAATSASAVIPDPSPVGQSASEAGPEFGAGGPTSGDAVLSAGPATEERTYVIQLATEAVPGRVGVAGARRTPSAASWRRDLRQEQADAQAEIGEVLGAKPDFGVQFTEAINGFTATLTGNDAAKVAQIDGVAAVTVDELYHLDSTSYGADWIGADTLWSGAGSGSVDATGEGIVIGIIDSGLNPANKSFADTVSVADGGDGYDHTNPLGAGKYLGMCDPESAAHVPNWGCNDKLIGAYNFTSLPVETYPNARSPYDDTAHGSHVASTAAGNRVNATWPAIQLIPTSSEIGVQSDQVTAISGVAPRANLISYDVCSQTSFKVSGCGLSDVVRAFEQAIVDRVDVINHSIGVNGALDPWVNPVIQAQLNARKAGISVAQSAGNSGSAVSSIGSFGDVPWVTSVANTSHDLGTTAGQVEFTTAAGAPAVLRTLPSNVVSGSMAAPAEVILASAIETKKKPADPNGTCDFETLPAESATGKVVVCLRTLSAGSARVLKGKTVRDAGGVGMILVNEVDGQTLPAELHALPTVHVSAAQGAALSNQMSVSPGLRARITGGSLTKTSANADVVNASSSRGPSINGTNTIGPSLSAPGTDVLAAGGVDNADTFQVMTGTSMAAPHVAGSIALLKQLHPTWSPSQIESALMTTSSTAVRDSDTDRSAATWFEMGSGRVDLPAATRAGLLLDVDPATYAAASPSAQGDLRTVNSAQIANGSCVATCHMTRTVTATEAGLGEWTAAVSTPDSALSLTLDRSSFELTSVGQSVDLRISATVTDPVVSWSEGVLTLTPPTGSQASPAHLPIAIKRSPGTLVGYATAISGDSGQRVVATADLGYVASDASVRITEPMPSQFTDLAVGKDSTYRDPYDIGSGEFRAVTVTAGTRALVVDLGLVGTALQAESPADLDLYVGTGTTPTKASTICASGNVGSRERCVIDRPAAGIYWMLTHRYTGGPAGTVGARLDVAQIAEGRPAAEGLTSSVVDRSTTSTYSDVMVEWDEPRELGGGWSEVEVTAPGKQVLTTFTRIDFQSGELTMNPVTGQVGTTVSPTWTLAPVSSGKEPTREITVDLPAGWTPVPGTITAGGLSRSAAGLTTVTWSGSQTELAALAGTTGPVTLSFDVVVPRPSREGQTGRFKTVDTAASNSGSSRSVRVVDVPMVGGSYPTSTTLTLGQNQITFGGDIEATASVSGAALADPSGSIEFTVGTQVAATVALVGGVATAQLGSGVLTAGTHMVTATYLGDGSNTRSTSAATAVTVVAIPEPTPTPTPTPSPTPTVKPTPKPTPTVKPTAKPVVKPVVKKAVSISAKPSGKVRRGKKAQSLVVRVAAPGVAPRGTVTVRIKGAGKTITKRVKVPASGVVRVKLVKYRKTGKVTVTVAYLGDAKTLARTVKSSFRVTK